MSGKNCSLFNRDVCNIGDAGAGQGGIEPWKDNRRRTLLPYHEPWTQRRRGWDGIFPITILIFTDNASSETKRIKFWKIRKFEKDSNI